MEKRNKHILINLTESQYKTLLFICDKNQRKAADQCYILLISALNKEALKLVDGGATDFKPLKYNNDND